MSDVVARLGFRGVIKLDFKEDERDGCLYLLEANPRFNLWHHPGAIAGVNLPALVYSDLVSPGSARPAELREPRPVIIEAGHVTTTFTGLSLLSSAWLGRSLG